MFERFTEEARRVVVLAQEEARLFRHDYIGTEHLALGIVHEVHGVAGGVLQRLGITPEDLRSRIEDHIRHGRKEPQGHIPFTSEAKEVLEIALREALQVGDNYIGAEHILVALIAEGKGVAAQALIGLGAALKPTRLTVLQVMAERKLADNPSDAALTEAASTEVQEADSPASIFDRFTDDARRAIVFAQEEARGLEQDSISPEHLVLGLLQEGKGVGARALKQCGVSLDYARSLAVRSRGAGSTRPADQSLPLTPDFQATIAASHTEAIALGHQYIDSGHLLLALTGDYAGLAVRILPKQDGTADRVRRSAIDLLTQRPEPSATVSSSNSTPTGHVFVSHSKTDVDYANRLVKHFEESGLRVWIDELGIDIGSRYSRVIRSAIDDSVAVVVIMSPEAEESHWVELEIKFAQAKKRPILPLLLRGDPFFLLSSIQYADVTDGSMPPESFLRILRP